jgi:hypothetical protein
MARINGFDVEIESRKRKKPKLGRARSRGRGKSSLCKNLSIRSSSAYNLVRAILSGAALSMFNERDKI